MRGLDKDTIEKVAEQYKAGWSGTELAKMYGLTPMAIYRYLDLCGVGRRKYRPRLIRVDGKLELYVPPAEPIDKSEIKCTVCGKPWSEIDFYPGYKRQCRECVCEDARDRWAKKRAASKFRKYQRPG